MGNNWGCQKKAGTKHKGQAKDRDQNARKRAATARKAPAEPLTSPPPAKKQKAKTTPVTEPTYEPSTSLHESYRRITIIYHYEELGCPAESEWSKRGGTLRQIANELKMPDPCDYARSCSRLGLSAWIHPHCGSWCPRRRSRRPRQRPKLRTRCRRRSGRARAQPRAEQKGLSCRS